MSAPEARSPAGREQATEMWWAVDPLLLQPHLGRVRLLSPRADKQLVVATEIGQLLLMAQGGVPREPTALLGWTPQKYLAVTRRLAAHGYLLGSREPREVPAPWNDWGVLAWAYHESLVHPPTPVTDTSESPETVSTRPSSFRAMNRDRLLLLPRLSPRGDKRFIDVLEQRRTHRGFRSGSIGIEAFSDILRYTFGPLRFADGGPMGVLQLRAAASGGARHETEAYVYVFAVDGVAPGLYAYDSLTHGLAAIREGDLRAEAQDLMFDPAIFREAGFGVITVAQADRVSWKYRDGSAYRMIWQNAGHAAQVFAMMCASLDLGTSMSGAIRVPEARQRLRLTEERDIVTFAMACGHPVLADNGLPVTLKGPTVPHEI